MTSEERITKNSERCAANKHLEFRGCVAVPGKNRLGNDYTRLDIMLSEGLDIKLFDPGKSIRDRGILSGRLTALCDTLKLDFMDIPPCKGGWIEFVEEVCKLVNCCKYKMIYVKLTVNENGWIEPGEGKCFSTEPDMEYTDTDLRFLENVDVVAPGTAIGRENLPVDVPRSEPKKVVRETRPVVRGNTETPGERIKPPKEMPFSEMGKQVDQVMAGIIAKDPNKSEKVDAESDTWELGSKPPDVDLIEEAVTLNILTGGKSVFEQFNEEAQKPEWVEKEAAAHLEKKPERKTRAKKGKVTTEPIDVTPIGEFPDIDDLPF